MVVEPFTMYQIGGGGVVQHLTSILLYCVSVLYKWRLEEGVIDGHANQIARVQYRENWMQQARLIGMSKSWYWNETNM